MGFRCRPAAERPLPLHGSRSGGRTHGSARALEGLSLAGALARGKRLVAEQAPSVYAALRGRFLELHRYGLRQQAVLRLSRARSSLRAAPVTSSAPCGPTFIASRPELLKSVPETVAKSKVKGLAERVKETIKGD
jgi:hypothetical protein